MRSGSLRHSRTHRAAVKAKGCRALVFDTAQVDWEALAKMMDTENFRSMPIVRVEQRGASVAPCRICAFRK